MKIFRMLPRLTTGLVAVVGAYFLYALLVAPLIEPSLEVPPPDRMPDPVVLHALPADILKLFPEGAWERNSPKILKTDHGILLFRDYETMEEEQESESPSTRVKVTPFTVIVAAADGPSAEPPLIMSAPAGAVLRFDGSLSFGEGEMGRLEGGRLSGDVTFRRAESQPGADDNLLVKTRNVHFTSQRITTTDQVNFRIGPNFGNGRILTIDLLPPNQADGPKKRATRTPAGLKSMVLLHVDEIQLFPEDDFDKRKTAQAPKPPVPVVITCAGPFHVDFETSVASFEDSVVVQRREDDSADQLDCSLLEIFFSENKFSENQSGKSGGEQDDASKKKSSLAVRQLVARGNPVLKHAENEIKATEILYELNDAGRVGRLLAKGPGTIHRWNKERRQNELVASWKTALGLRPDGETHVISLIDEARVGSDLDGFLKADTIHVWLLEVESVAGDERSEPSTNSSSDPGAYSARPQPLKKKRFDLVPQNMLAEGNVTFDSPSASGTTARVEAWFENPVALDQLGLPSDGRIARAGNKNTLRGAHPDLVRLPAAEPDSRNWPTQSKQKFNLSGNQIRLRLVQQDQRTTVREAVVLDNVRLLETRVADAGALPIDISGRSLQLQMDAAQNAVVHVIGEPATVAARGMTMTAPKISLDQANNLLWINGAGQMTLPAEKPAGTHNVSYRQVKRARGQTHIDWQKEMSFNGETVNFSGDVHVQTLDRMDDGKFVEANLNSNAIQIAFNQRIKFDDSKSAKPNDVKANTVYLEGKVSIVNRTYDHRQELISYDHIEARDALINNVSGDIVAKGPDGSATTVRYSDDKTFSLTSRQQPAPRAPAEQPRKPQLTFTEAHFEDHIEGNLFDREISFVGRVETVHGPVEHWEQRLDPRYKNGLGKDGIVLQCDRLTLSEMGPQAGKRTREVKASGNAHVTGHTFEANAEQIKFNEDKETLILEGGDRTDATISYQPRFGAQRSFGRAQKIIYSRKTQSITVNQGDVFDFSNLGGLPPSASQPRR